MLDYLMIDVIKVTSSLPRSTFSESDLEILADHILETGGILKPVILKKIGFEKYEVIDGHFEYYASVKASEKDAVKGEMVNAFIISAEQEEAVNLQIKQLQTTSTKVSGIDSDSRINNLELRLEKRFNELQDSYKQDIIFLDKRLKELEKNIQPPVGALEALNNYDVSQLAKASFNKSIAKKIITTRETKGKFISFEDAIERVYGLGEKRMIKFIDYLANN